MNGGDRQMVVSGINLPWNTAIYENHVYWSSYGGIERADRFTGSNHQIVLNTTENIISLRVNHPSKQQRGECITHTAIPTIQQTTID